MKKNLNLRISVFMNTAAQKAVFIRDLYLSPVEVVPYTQISDALRYLFGTDCVIKFESVILKDM